MTDKLTYEELEKRVKELEVETLKQKQSGDRSRLIFEKANDAILYFDSEGILLDMNRSAADMFGYIPEETIGKKLKDFDNLEPEEFQKIVEIFDIAISGRQIPMLELDLFPIFGTPYIVEASARLTRKDGEIQGLSVFVRDITARKEAEEALRESEEKFRAIFNNAYDEILYVDENGVFLDVNKRVEDIFGWKREECIGKNFMEFNVLDEEGIQENAKLISDLMEGKPGRVIEVGAFHKDGSPITIEVSASLMKKNDRLQGIVNIIRDVTKRKRLEADLISSNENLNMARSAAIMGLAKLAEYRDKSTGSHLERIREYVKVIAEALQNIPKYESYITSEYIEDIYVSSILHDIGKVSTPDSILMKPGKLTNDEFEQIKDHTIIGGDALAAADVEIRGRSFLTLGREIAYFHHEKWSGKGYPKGLKGEEIPLCARIVALADVYDALTSIRPYKEAFTHDEAKKIIASETGYHFAPDIVKAFLENEDKFEQIRSRLQNGM